MPSPPAIVSQKKNDFLVERRRRKQQKRKEKNKFQLILKLLRGGMSLCIFYFSSSALCPSRRAMCLNKHLQIMLCIFSFFCPQCTLVTGCVGKFMLYIICGTNTDECGMRFSLFPHQKRFSLLNFARREIAMMMLPSYRLPECAAGQQICMHFSLIHRKIQVHCDD